MADVLPMATTPNLLERTWERLVGFPAMVGQPQHPGQLGAEKGCDCGYQGNLIGIFNSVTW